MLSEKSQSQKNTCCVVSATCVVQSRQIYREREVVVAGGGGVAAGDEGVTTHRHRVSLLEQCKCFTIRL